MSDQNLAMRRKIVQLGIGDTARISLEGVQPEALIIEAKRFARRKNLEVIGSVDGDSVIIQRVEVRPQISLYPEIDRLDVGQSHLFDLPAAMHQRIRLAASNRNRAGAVRLACTREGDAIRVTRLALTDEDLKTSASVSAPARATKYRLDRLSTETSIRFDVTREDRAKLRLAVSNYAARQGWVIRCRLQDDGTMLVYRTDTPAEPQA